MTKDEEALANMARLSGVDPERALTEYRHGGALADLLRAFLGNYRPRRTGPEADLRENWRRFVLVVVAGREKRSGKFAAAAAMGQQGKDDPEDRALDRYRTTYRRMTKRGWRDEDVPEGLAAFFSDPPADKLGP